MNTVTYEQYNEEKAPLSLQRADTTTQNGSISERHSWQGAFLIERERDKKVERKPWLA